MCLKLQELFTKLISKLPIYIQEERQKAKEKQKQIKDWPLPSWRSGPLLARHNNAGRLKADTQGAAINGWLEWLASPDDSIIVASKIAIWYQQITLPANNLAPTTWCPLVSFKVEQIQWKQFLFWLLFLQIKLNPLTFYCSRLAVIQLDKVTNIFELMLNQKTKALFKRLLRGFTNVIGYCERASPM